MYFDIDAHRHCFATNPDEAYFRHGETNGVGGPYTAMDIAIEGHGKTLEKCMLDHREELEKAGVFFDDRGNKKVRISYGSNDDESNHFWDACSQAFAEQASGNVHVIEGTDIRPNGQSELEFPSVYNRIEHPALEQNPNVNSIIYVNPETRQVTGVEYLNHTSPQIQSTNHTSLTGIDPTHTSGTSPPVHNESDTAYRSVPQAQVPGNEVVSDEALKKLQQSDKPTYPTIKNEIPSFEQLKINNQTVTQKGISGNEVMTDEQLQNMKNSLANGTTETAGNAIDQGAEHVINGVSASSSMGGGIT